MEATLRPTDLLKADHQDVLAKLQDLRRVIDGLDEPDAILSDLKELGSFFETEIWTHFAKEEQALFPEIERFLPREKGPTGQMLREHEDLRKTNERFQSGVAGYLEDPGDAQAAAQIQESGRYIIELLGDHIHKEDNVLFKMADMHLSEEQNRRVLDRFAEVEASAS